MENQSQQITERDSALMEIHLHTQIQILKGQRNLIALFALVELITIICLTVAR